MSETTSSARSRRTIWIIAAIAAVVVVAVVIWGVATGWGAGSAAPGSTPTSTGSASAQPSATQATPEPAETEPVDEGEAEEPAPRETTAPVGLDQTAEPAAGLGVTLVAIEAIDGVAAVPGEVSGPALQVTVRVDNVTESEITLEAPIVNLYFGAESTPANILVNPREDLVSAVASGQSITGVYAFTVPADQRGRIVVEADLGVELPVVLFEGAL